MTVLTDRPNSTYPLMIIERWQIQLQTGDSKWYTAIDDDRRPRTFDIEESARFVAELLEGPGVRSRIIKIVTTVEVLS